MTRTQFDLLHEPWIPVQDLAGAWREVGLLDVFAQAHRLRRIDGELPTTSVALHRLLLAVLHRCQHPGDGDPVAVWRHLWQAPALPDDVQDYLAEFADHFDLLHASQPFYQTPGLHSKNDEVKGLDTILADVPNNEKFFTTRAGHAVQRIGFAEAARWLVHCQAFDVSGIKTGAVGDPRVKGGKGYPIGPSWTGRLGVVLLEGDTLQQTLLLNLRLADSEGRPWAAGPGTAQAAGTPHDLPLWERAPLTAAPDATRGAGPTGPADLMTWPSRRVRLVHDGDAVTGVVLAQGDPVDQLNKHRLETMTSWRHSENQARTHKISTAYMPRTHSPDRAFWRGLESVLPQTVRPAGAGTGPAPHVAPLTVRWVADLRRAGVLGDGVVRARAVGVEYGSNQSVVAEIVDDALAVQVALLADPAATATALAAVGATDTAVFELGRFARHVAIAAAGPGVHVDPAGDRAREHAFHDLDAPFRRWLSALGAPRPPSAPPADPALGWRLTARDVLVDHARRIAEEAGVSAWVGRTVEQNKVPRSFNTARGLLEFERALDKALGADPRRSPAHTQPTTSPSPSDDTTGAPV